MTPQLKRGKACSACHNKKIKCDLSATNQPCTNCRLGDYACRPHQRKRRANNASLSPEPADHSPKRRASQGAANTYRVPTAEVDHTSSNPNLGRPQVEAVAPSPQVSLSQNNDAYETPPTTDQSFIGRSEYLASQVPFTEDAIDSPGNPPMTPKLTNLDIRFLKLRKALDLPPRAVRESLIDAFMERCHPWMPIVERRWLEDNEERPPSLLLLQSVFLAGSRVSSSRIVHTTSSEFYERARALFVHEHEQNTLLTVVAVCLLHWWNPTGPEKFSTNTSGFWVRIGVELAYQVGLHKEPADGPFKSFRRRLWWSLFCRDIMISVGTGRPRTINLEDSNVEPPVLEDFAIPDLNAHLFVAYVSICKQLGDIAEAQRRGSLTHSARQRFEDALFRWLKELPQELRIVHRDEGRWKPVPYSFEARQLAILYFLSLIILYRSSNAQAPVSTICLLASSFVSSIFEEFLSRDQLRFLGPVFAFHALAAGLFQLTGLRYDGLRTIAEHEYNVIRLALEELGKTWGSAHGALHALTRAKDAVELQPRITEGPAPLSSRAIALFIDFGPELCPLWNVGFANSANYSQAAVLGSAGQPDTWESPAAGRRTAPGQTPVLGPISKVPVLPLTFDDVNVANIYDYGTGERAGYEETLAPLEESWLFEDFDLHAILAADSVNP